MLNIMNLMPIGIICGILIIFWFAIREVKMWYWKVNDIVSLLTSINDKLSHIIEKDDPFYDVNVKRESTDDSPDESWIYETEKIKKIDTNIEEGWVDNHNQRDDIPVATNMSKIKDILNKRIF